VLQIALDEGATTINIPDTVGYSTPGEYAGFLTRLYELVPDLRGAVLSTHCHDDLGLAVANSLAGVQAGARQVECAINGIGERAGNASLEEIVMLLHTRAADLGYTTGIQTREIARTSRMVSRLTGYPVQPNKAVVGRNAFAHESGIHQDGVLKHRQTYEIMDATTIGLEGNDLVLGKHSGRHALKSALAELGFEVDGQALNTAFKRFKELADRKKQVTAMDLEALVTDELRDQLRSYTLHWFDVDVSNRRPPHARVAIRTPDGEEALGDFTGDGPVDAIFRAINAATTRSPAARTRWARRASCWSSRASPPRARASRPTSSRRRPRPTFARSPTRSGRCTPRRPRRSRRSSSPGRRRRRGAQLGGDRGHGHGGAQRSAEADVVAERGDAERDGDEGHHIGVGADEPERRVAQQRGVEQEAGERVEGEQEAGGGGRSGGRVLPRAGRELAGGRPEDEQEHAAGEQLRRAGDERIARERPAMGGHHRAQPPQHRRAERGGDRERRAPDRRSGRAQHDHGDTREAEQEPDHGRPVHGDAGDAGEDRRPEHVARRQDRREARAQVREGHRRHALAAEPEQAGQRRAAQLRARRAAPAAGEHADDPGAREEDDGRARERRDRLDHHLHGGHRCAPAQVEGEEAGRRHRARQVSRAPRLLS
jgi:hypothetical protein